MAIYDKRDFRRDAKAGQYFRHDYIYKKNMRMRFFLSIGCIILLLFYVLYLLAIEEADVFALDFQAEALRVLFVVLVIMVAYSFLGTIIYMREFLKSEKRVNAYFAMMKQLSAIETQMDVADESDEEHEAFEPYRPRDAADLEYRYASDDTDD